MMRQSSCWKERRDVEKGQGQEEEGECFASTSPQLMELSPSEQSSASSFSDIIEGTISFRPLQESDRDVIKDLHEEWFPVTYKDGFYDDLVHQRMFHSGEKLFTCAAIYHADEGISKRNFRNNTENNSEMQQDDCDGRLKLEETPLIGLSPCESPEPRHITRRYDNMEGQIVSCVVGTFLDISSLDGDMRASLISNPDRYRRVFYIMTLGTVNEFRHYRLASTLVEKCIQLVERDTECGVLYLHVITFNQAAIRFYEKLGFYRVKEIKDYYRIDEDHHNCYLYAKYFHGNRGEWDVYYHFQRAITSLLERVAAPLSIILPKKQSSR